MAYIEKGPIIEFITKGLNNPDKTKAFGYDAIEILTEIEYAPTADVVEVVRCEDCKYWEEEVFDHLIEHKIGECHCPQWEDIEFWYNTQDNDYCSYGERRDA